MLLQTLRAPKLSRGLNISRLTRMATAPELDAGARFASSSSSSSSHHSHHGHTEPSVLVADRGHASIVTLNRPKALNALNVDMCHHMISLLNQWHGVGAGAGAAPSNTHLVIMKGAGGKAFCAGGDVKGIWQMIHDKKADINAITHFFRVEYIMNYMLAKSKVPQVSLWDGIVMGGGVGISALGRYRICTEKTTFAMPETAIGLFPDVGSTSWLSKLDNGLGEYIGLTGVRLNAADLIAAGIATHFVPSDRLADLEAALCGYAPNAAYSSTTATSTSGSPKAHGHKHHHGDAAAASAEARTADAVRFIDHELARFATVPPASSGPHGMSPLQANAAAIKRCFWHMPSVSHVMHALEAEIHAAPEGSGVTSGAKEWAETTLKTLRKSSPSSLFLTLDALHRARGLHSDVKQCLEMEFRLVRRCMQHRDFYEGVRALLVDKDNKPNWVPDSVDHASPRLTLEYFKPLPSRGDELVLPEF